MALYDSIGKTYDSTRCADPYLLSRLIHHLRPSRGFHFLDLGCGTGNYTIAMRAAGADIIGADFSQVMLSRARQKNPALPWYNARAEALPFGSNVFSGATCTFVHHHLQDTAAAFSEVFRVLKPKARFVLLNATVEQLEGYWLHEYFPRAMAQAIEPYRRFEAVGVLGAVGFKIECLEPYEIAPDLKDWFLYCGKNRPDRYLDPQVRSGISTFAAAKDQEEIACGCERLANDISSGRVADVIRSYERNKGDYMFTVASK
ncbi:MAG TPA: methyltransferase domain-containing protein [Candidatus Binataceae bacterium]